MIRYLDEIRPLVLMSPERSSYVKIIKDKDGDKDKNKNNILMSFRIDNDKLLENTSPFWLQLKFWKILNWLLYKFMMVDM